ncbi:MAG: diheme cytochrome c-553 [Ignavibacteriales bacterium]|nr:MAG: diheme cytochrome c-553 [Ignavibacteriales bacterium]
MKKYIAQIFLFSAFIFSIFLQINCSKNEEAKAMSPDEIVAKGEYLVNLGGCNDCHSPKVFTEMGPMFDTTKLLSGHPSEAKLFPVDTSVTNSKWMHTSMDLTAWVGPWGVSFAANLTPDGPTGLGNWTDEIFIKAIRTGKHMGFGRGILPPMPWQNYALLTEDDLKTIFAYLKSLPAISNKVPDPIPPNMVAQSLNIKGKM